MTESFQNGTNLPEQPNLSQGSLLPYELTPQERSEIADAKRQLRPDDKIFFALGVHELYMPSFYKAALIEFSASGIFVYFHIAIVLAATKNGSDYPPTAIAMCHGILLTMMILSFGRSSGAHINSLITMSCITTKHILFCRGIVYIIAQIMGAYIGALCMVASLPDNVAESIGLGGCNPGTLTTGQALIIDVFTALIMLIPSYGTAFNEKQRNTYGPIIPPIVIGMTLMLMIYTVSALGDPPFTPGGFPSMCLGISMAYSEIVGNDEAFRKGYIYWIGPIIAIILNSSLYGIAPPHHDDSPAESENGGENVELVKPSFSSK